MLDEAHEGLDSCQPSITDTGTVVSCGLDVGEKIHYQHRIDLFQVKFRRCHLVSIARELEEQLKGVGVTLASVMASATLQRKAFP
jgi:hypothetical protein